MSGGESGFVVVIGRKEDWRPTDLAPVLAGFRGVPAIDVAREIRRARGIFPVEGGEADAERLAGALRTAGFAATHAPAPFTRPLPEARLLRHVLPADDALFVRFRDGSEERVPWDRVRLAAVASFHTILREKVAGSEGPDAAGMAMSIGTAAVVGIPVRFGDRKPAPRTVTKTDIHLFVELVLRDPEVRLRVDGSRFDFSGLGADMTYNAFANMRILLAHIVHRADMAETSPGADLLLEGGRLSSLGYEDLEDFEREERWLLSILPA